MSGAEVTDEPEVVLLFSAWPVVASWEVFCACVMRPGPRLPRWGASWSVSHPLPLPVPWVLRFSRGDSEKSSKCHVCSRLRVQIQGRFP